MYVCMYVCMYIYIYIHKPYVYRFLLLLLLVLGLLGGLGRRLSGVHKGGFGTGWFSNLCYYYIIIAKPPFTKPPFVNSRALGAALGEALASVSSSLLLLLMRFVLFVSSV